MARKKTNYILNTAVLIQCRKKHNLIQSDMADSLGITTATYQAYEAGKNEPPLENLRRIAELLHVSADTLIGVNPEKVSIKKNQVQFPSSESEAALQYAVVDGGLSEEKIKVMEQVIKHDLFARLVQKIGEAYHAFHTEKELTVPDKSRSERFDACIGESLVNQLQKCGCLEDIHKKLDMSEVRIHVSNEEYRKSLSDRIDMYVADCTAVFSEIMKGVLSNGIIPGTER